jgi:hypothetical protein
VLGIKPRAALMLGKCSTLNSFFRTKEGHLYPFFLKKTALLGYN